MVSSDSGRGGWNKTVNMAVRCVVGSRTNLNAIAPNPIPGVVDPAVESGNVSLVNYPLTFNLMLPFTDTIIPKFVPPYPLLYPPEDGKPTEETLIADTLIRPQVVADRPATLYYLVAPVNANGKNTVDPALVEVEKEIQNPATPDTPDMIKVITFEQDNLNDCLAWAMLSGDKVPSGGIYGTMDIKDTTLHTLQIEGLEPNKEYDLFLVLKGTPAEPSDVWHRRFTTLEIAPPVLQRIQVNPIVVPGTQEDAAQVTIWSDKYSNIWWAIYPEDAVKDYLNDDGHSIKEDAVPTVISMIRDTFGEASQMGALDHGEEIAEQSGNLYLTKTFQTKNGTGNYRVLAIAQSLITGNPPTEVGELSDILVSDRFSRLDIIPPDLLGDRFTVNNNIVNVTFDKALYHWGGDNGRPTPVTEESAKTIDILEPAGASVIKGLKDANNVVDTLSIQLTSAPKHGDTLTIMAIRRLANANNDAMLKNITLTYVDGWIGPDGNAFTGYVVNIADYSAPPPETPDTPTPPDSTRTLFSNRGHQTVQTFGTAMNPPRVVTGISAVSAINRGGDYSGVVTVTFNGKVFYRDVDGSFQPISNVTTLMDGLEMYGSGIITGATESSFTAYSNLPDGTQASGKTLSTAKLRFSDVQEGDRLVCTMTLYDTDGKALNGFTLDFVDMENRAGANTGFSQARQQSRWELQ